MLFVAFEKLLIYNKKRIYLACDVSFTLQGSHLVYSKSFDEIS
jgi:hypothetical protein